MFVARSRGEVRFLARRPGRGLLPLRHLRSSGLRSGLLPLPPVRPGRPLLLSAVHRGSTQGVAAGGGPPVPAESTWSPGPRGAAAGVSRASRRGESDASGSKKLAGPRRGLRADRVGLRAGVIADRRGGHSCTRSGSASTRGHRWRGSWRWQDRRRPC